MDPTKLKFEELAARSEQLAKSKGLFGSRELPGFLGRRKSAPGRLASSKLHMPCKRSVADPAGVTLTEPHSAALYGRPSSLTAMPLSDNPLVLAYPYPHLPVHGAPAAEAYRRCSMPGPTLVRPRHVSPQISAQRPAASRRGSASTATEIANSTKIESEVVPVVALQVAESDEGWKIKATFPGFTKNDLFVLLVHDPRHLTDHSQKPCIRPVTASRGEGVPWCAIYMEAIRIQRWTDDRNIVRKKVFNSNTLIPLGAGTVLVGSLRLGDMLDGGRVELELDKVVLKYE